LAAWICAGSIQHPGRSGLVEQCPEHGDKQVYQRQTADHRGTGAAQRLAYEAHAGRRNVHEPVPPRPEHQGGECHQHARHRERQRCPHLLQQPGRQQHGNESAQVDGEIEPAEHSRQQTTVGTPELVAQMRRHAGLDATGAERDQRQPDGQTDAGVVQRQHQVAQAVHQRQRDDGAVLAQHAVGQQRAQQGREIHRRHEQVVPALGLLLAHQVQGTAGIQQVLGHEHHQDGAHAIETEALGAFVGDDVGNAGRQTLGGKGRGAVGWHGRSIPVRNSCRACTQPLTAL